MVRLIPMVQKALDWRINSINSINPPAWPSRSAIYYAAAADKVVKIIMHNKVCSALDPDKVRSEGRCKERGKRVSLNFVPDTC